VGRGGGVGPRRAGCRPRRSRRSVVTAVLQSGSSCLGVRRLTFRSSSHAHRQGISCPVRLPPRRREVVVTATGFRRCRGRCTAKGSLSMRPGGQYC